MAKVLSDIKRSVKSVASATKKKTKEVAETTKLKLDIKMEESNLDHCFEQLGRAVYANSKTSNNGKRVEELLLKAEKISEIIKEYKSRLAFIQGKKVCNHCESVIDFDGPCEFCNEKIVANEKVKEEKSDDVDNVTVIDLNENQGEEQDEIILTVEDDE